MEDERLMDEDVRVIDQVEEPEDIEEGPVFLNPGDAVEVNVDDETIPMDVDDDDDYDNDDNENFNKRQDQGVTTQVREECHNTSVVDMSKLQMQSHSGPVYSIAAHLSASNTLRILSGGGDDKAYLHSVSSMNTACSDSDNIAPTNYSSSKSIVHSQPMSHPYSDTVSSVALNLDFLDDKTPPYAATGCYDGSIVIYNAESGQHLCTLEGPSDVEFITFHPKGGSVLLAGSAMDATLWMFHVPLNRCLQVFVGHEDSVSCGTFTSDGRWVISGSTDGTVRLWAPRTGTCKHVFRFPSVNGCAARITTLNLNPHDSQVIMVGTEDGQSHLCHVGTHKILSSLLHSTIATNLPIGEAVELPISVEAVGVSPVKNWGATGGLDGVLKIWDLSTGQCRQVCHLSRQNGTEESQSSSSSSPSALGGITRLVWLPKYPFVLTCTTLGSLYLWDARTGRLLHTLTGHKDVVNDMHVLFVPQSYTAIIVSAGEDKVIRLFELDIKAFV